MSALGTEVWREAAIALANSDPAALEVQLPKLPHPAAEALKAAVRYPALPCPVAPSFPEGVEWFGDSRFFAVFASRHITIQWNQPGRELITGCYLTPKSQAQFSLEPGECRFVLLRES